jgi:hypothetical protein
MVLDIYRLAILDGYVVCRAREEDMEDVTDSKGN